MRSYLRAWKASHSGEPLADRPEPTVIPLADAYVVFRGLGVDVSSLSKSEFKRVYHRLALEHQNRTDSHQVMAHINVARSSIEKLHRWAVEDPAAASPMSTPEPRRRFRKRFALEELAPDQKADRFQNRASADEDYERSRAALNH